MSPTAQPLSKGAQIIAQLNELIQRKDADDFTLKRLKAEAEKIKENNLVDAFSILGMIACIEQDIENLHSYHKSAITYSNESARELSHYVVSLINSKLYEDAYKYSLKVFKKAPTDEKNLDILIKAISELNLEEEFGKYTSIWFDLKKEPHRLTIYPKALVRSIEIATDQMLAGEDNLSYEEVFGG
ncbi:MAG: hypothetical protein H8D96_11640 [Desulfobacterales bacterium]|uniref:Uncharacterized protein n=1 Tax=Candidatus Desulfatibia vada TaxID=2841696 RepID=A0A8J6NRY3_9BACT|nr:hypothetical protein [Candidatus Desulfatibia vada]